MNAPLAGRAALVTGGTRGIGAAVAAALAADGAAVAITGTDGPTAKRKAAEIAAETGGTVAGVAWSADLGEVDEQADAVVAWATAELGPVDVLVNNAGTIARGPALDVSIGDWDRLLRLNLTAPLAMSQAVARRLVQAKRAGSIVNVVSVLAFSAGREVVGYTASKAALVQLTRALAVEWALAGINVNAVAAGYCLTAMTAQLHGDPRRYEQTLARIPMARWAEPEEIAQPVAFLCSPAARYVTGAVLAVDGGWGAA